MKIYYFTTPSSQSEHTKQQKFSSIELLAHHRIESSRRSAALQSSINRLRFLLTNVTGQLREVVKSDPAATGTRNDFAPTSASSSEAAKPFSQRSNNKGGVKSSLKPPVYPRRVQCRLASEPRQPPLPTPLRLRIRQAVKRPLVICKPVKRRSVRCAQRTAGQDASEKRDMEQMLAKKADRCTSEELRAIYGDGFPAEDCLSSLQ